MTARTTIKYPCVTLTDEERAEANALGTARQMNNRRYNVSRNGQGRLGKDDDQMATWLIRDQRGVRGEFAFAKMIEADAESWAMIRAIGVQSAAMGTDPADVIGYTADGTRVSVDVKTTEYQRGKLLIGMEKVHVHTVYVLVVEDFLGRFEYRGAMTFDRAMEMFDRGIVYEGSRQTLWVEQQHLLPLDVCLEEIAAKRKGLCY